MLKLPAVGQCLWLRDELGEAKVDVGGEGLLGRSGNCFLCQLPVHACT